MRGSKQFNQQSGFSLLELVIAVSILCVLVSFGALSYSSLNKRAKTASTEQAAEIVYSAAYMYLLDDDSKTHPEDAAEQFNNNELDADDETIPVQSNLYGTLKNAEPIVFEKDETETPNKEDDSDKKQKTASKIFVEVEVIDSTRVKVIAKYLGTDITATRETPVESPDRNNGGTVDEDNENPSEGAETPVEETPGQADGENSDEIKDPSDEIKDPETLPENSDEEDEGDASGETIPDKTMPDSYDNDSLSRLTYRCDSKKTGYIGVLNTDSTTEVFWKKKNEADSEATFIPYLSKTSDLIIDQKVSEQISIANHSEALTLEAGITYEVIVLGSFQILSSPGSLITGDNLSDCLISSGTLGSKSGLEYLTYLSADKLTTVSSTIPSTVKSLQGAFNDAEQFNDSNVVSWDTSNVQDMSYLFKNSENFNQPIGSWNTGNVKDMTGMFEGAKSFDQTIRKWDVKDVVSMSAMFKNAESFNQVFTPWNAKSVRDTSSMFEGATSFNQKMSGFHTHNVVDMSRMFKNATSFNGQVSSWNVDNVQNMKEMFYNAKSFNQKFNGWKVHNVSEYSNFATGSALKSNALPKFN